MISFQELRVTAETGQKVRLSRYTLEEFATLFPLPDSQFDYVSTECIDGGYGDPDEEFDIVVGNWCVTDWGIFVPERDGAEQMVGNISLSSDNGTERGLGTRIAREDAHNRGIGTLAKAAVAGFAFGRGASAVRSVTANPASKVSLSRLGFVNCGPLDPPEICGFDKVLRESDHFVLWNNPSDAPSRHKTDAFGGRSRFDQFLSTLYIVESEVWPQD